MSQRSNLQSDVPSTETIGAVNRRGAVGMIIFFSFFFLLGAVVFTEAFVLPAIRAARAGSWTAQPCVIDKSSVKDHPASGDDGETYSPEISYHYDFLNVRHASTRYRFLSMSYGNRSVAEAVVDRYPAGQPAICYVDPSNPAEAVLDRSLGNDFYLGLIPLVFVLIGVGGIGYSVRRLIAPPAPLSDLAASDRAASDRAASRFAGATRKSPSLEHRLSAAAARNQRAASQAGLQDAPVAAANPNAPATLKPAQSRFAPVIAVGLFALIWNFVIGIFLVVGITQRSSVSLTMDLFMVPFLLVGVGSIVAVGYMSLSLFNPSVTATLTPGSLLPGESAELHWRFDGQYDRITHLTVRLRGREEAVYTRGTDTITDKNVFYDELLIDTTRSLDVFTGKVRLNIPPSAMHSFESRHNRVIWSIDFDGEIKKFWPNAKESFPIRVLAKK